MTATLPPIEQTETYDTTNKDQVVVDLRNARDIIATRGWLQNKYFEVHDAGTPACLVGAAILATMGNVWSFFLSDSPRLAAVCHELAVTLGSPGGVRSRPALYKFNDSECTEKADVIGLFDTTIKRMGG
jgi:hypothetical protein